MTLSFHRELFLEGVRSDRRESVLDLLADRFRVDAARSVSDTVNAIKDVKLLWALLLKAAFCSDLDEFHRALPPPRPRRKR